MIGLYIFLWVFLIAWWGLLRACLAAYFSSLEIKKISLHRMAIKIEDVFNIITKKADEKAKNWDFKTTEEYWTYIYEHELPFIEMAKKEGWTKENDKRAYYWPDGKKY